MFHLWMMLIGLLFAALLILFYKHYRAKDKVTLQREGLRYLQQLRLLLNLLQKHRSMVAHYVQNEPELDSEIKHIQQDIKLNIDDILQKNNKILANELWLSISEHWAKLSQNFPSHSADNNVLQHNSLIQNVLYLIDDIALGHGLTRLKLSGIKNNRVLWCEWLVALECIDQVKTMGTTVLLDGACNNTARIRLTHLQQKITETTDRAWRGGLPANEEQKAKVNQLLACIKIEIINASQNQSINLRSKDYCQLCDSVRDKQYEVFDQLLSQTSVG
ncbi:hypothetical protein [Flavobacterium sp. W21_SRS_FM6]|uniref:hypothetical protein n=1 Tax=Flavobacterium sp. W21_SRS_FM6 TaxID=3240268 RepID=UPI003F8F5732